MSRNEDLKVSMKSGRARPVRKVPEDVAAKFEAMAEVVGNGEAPDIETAKKVVGFGGEQVEAQPAATGEQDSGILEQPSRNKNKYKRKKDGVQIRPLSAHVPVQLFKELKMYCAANDLKISDVVVRALEKELKR